MVPKSPDSSFFRGVGWNMLKPPTSIVLSAIFVPYGVIKHGVLEDTQFMTVIFQLGNPHFYNVGPPRYKLVCKPQ